MKSALLVIGVVVVLGLSIYLVASAANFPDQDSPSSGNHQTKSGPHLLMRYVRANMAARTIAEISKQPVDTIRKKLEEQRLPAVLTEYHVDRKAFAQGMRTKFQDLLGQLKDDGYLTIDQRDHILMQVDRYRQRRTLMKGLIDKGLTDGTITPDQAEMLLKRPH
ncbi:MAG: hypothetical protein HY895_04405 [Deltaproteobacteria bacterium]|nr:hypothetical protein [Deltaproteobacteria bacterium]